MHVTNFSIIIVVIISSSATFFIWEPLVSISDNFRSDLCLIELNVSNVLEFKPELSFNCAFQVHKIPLVK